MAIARRLVALVSGFLLGGFTHLWVADDVARSAIAVGGISLFMWNGKSVSEINAVLSIFYALFLVAWMCLVGVSSAAIGLDFLRQRRLPRFTHARFVGFWFAGIAAAFGALGAITLNQQILTATYRDDAEPGSYLAATIDLGLPAMQSLTAAWQRSLLVFLVLLGFVGVIERLRYVRGKSSNTLECASD